MCVYLSVGYSFIYVYYFSVHVIIGATRYFLHVCLLTAAEQGPVRQEVKRMSRDAQAAAKHLTL